MTAGDWANVLTLVNNGIQSSDNVFTIRTDAIGNLFTSSQTITGRTQSNAPGSNTYKLSERWVQEFKTGDSKENSECNTGNSLYGAMLTEVMHTLQDFH